MKRKEGLETPKYHQIATDIASKIVNGQYKEGDKIYARSTLASQYGVSSETSRRAISILSDLNIVETTKGSGVVIKSYENALSFVRQYQQIETVTGLKQKLLESVGRQRKEIDFFNNCLTKLIENTDRFHSINPFVPYEIEIIDSTPYIHKTIAEVNFWHNTSATIIAIKRDEKLILSPGPYMAFLPRDIFYFIGDENCPSRVRSFLFP